MIRITTQGLDSVIVGLEAIPRSLKYAIPNYQNALAFGVRENTMSRIKQVFPTARPQTAKNVFVRKATSSNSGAVVLFDQIYRRGMDEYMLPNVEGGARQRKPSEQRLGRFYVPGAGAKLDRYGNMRGGQVTQILSRMGRFGDVAGYNMNQTARSKSRRRGAAKSLEYFMVTSKTGGLVPGIYQRTQGGVGFGGKTSKALPSGSFQKGTTKGRYSSVIRSRGVVPVMIFTRQAPRYRAVWPFFTDAQQWIDNNYKRIANNIILAEMDKELAYRARHGR